MLKSNIFKKCYLSSISKKMLKPNNILLKKSLFPKQLSKFFK